MRLLVTGSAGHLGEALLRTLAPTAQKVVGVDIKSSPFTDFVGSITDRAFVRECMAGIAAVIHSATLHKPHVATHSRQAFIDTNISGTLNLLEEAVAATVKTFIYTSTTSTFGDAMDPADRDAAVWVTERLQPKRKNIYAVSKIAAENLSQLFSRNFSINCVALRTSHFFPESDDNRNQRESFADENLKVNGLLFRRVEIADVVTAHHLALRKAPDVGFERFIISASTPFQRADAPAWSTP